MRKMNLLVAVIATACITLGSVSAQEKTLGDLSAQVELGAQEEAAANVQGELKQKVEAGIENATAQVEAGVNAAASTANTQAGGAASVNAQTNGAQANGDVQANGSAQNESWRYRDYNGRKWYWQGDPKTGSWSYMNNGSWTPFNSTTGFNSQANAGVSQANAGVQAQSQASGYHGPYYFDASGRRYTSDGNTYTPDQTWNNRVWNNNYSNAYGNDYQNNYRNYWNNNSNAYSGAVNAGANVGGAVGQAIGGQAGGQIGAGIGAAIGQGR